MLEDAGKVAAEQILGGLVTGDVPGHRRATAADDGTAQGAIADRPAY